MGAEVAVVYLAGCAVEGVIPDRERIMEMDMEAVFATAAAHMLTACVSLALEAAGVRDQRTTRALASAVRRAALFDSACAQVCQRLEQAGIWYAPLKGMVIRHDYPKPLMREMGDHDMLFDASRAEDVRNIMEELGFETESFGAVNHDVYHRPPMVSFEMHSTLFGEQHDPQIYEYFRHFDQRLMGDGGCARRLSPEDFYLYMVAHEYKHFSGDGTGLRSLLDTYVFLKKHGDSLDMAYIDTEMQKLGIAAFEKTNRELAQRLFTGQALTDEDRSMLDYVLHSGVYGSGLHHFEKEVRKFGQGKAGKIRYFFHRLFLPMDTLKAVHPLIYRSKILIPFYAVYRIVRALLVSRENVKGELRGLRTIK